MKKVLLLAAAVSALSFSLAADEEMAVDVNGNFRGFSFLLAPGWHENDGDGDASIGEGRRMHRELHITSPADGAQSVSSDAFAVKGKILCVEMESVGRGNASIGIEMYDAQEALIAEEPQVRQICTGHGRLDKKYYFRMAENAVSAKIVLNVSGDAEVIFGDIEAKYTDEITPAILAALEPPKVKPAKVSDFDKMQRPFDTVLPTSILDGSTIKAEKLFDGDLYQITLALGGEIEFFVEEQNGETPSWKISSYNDEKCRIKIASDEIGVWPFEKTGKRISVKAKLPGVSDIVFLYGDKEIKVRLNIL